MGKSASIIMNDGDSKISYQQILRATSIIGSSSVINIALQLIRVKVLAVMLGLQGMGIMGIYGSILSTAGSLAGLGMNTSAVRYVADARHTGADDKVALYIQALTFACVTSGLVAASAVFLYRDTIARLTLGSMAYGVEIGWLAVGVFVSTAGSVYSVLLRSFRRIGDQARTTVVGGVASTILAICFVWVLGEGGIVCFLLGGAFASVLAAWWFSRGLSWSHVRYSIRDLLRASKCMIEEGFYIMVSLLLHGGVQLAVRGKITAEMDIEATGLFTAAWAISYVYMGFLLQAMGSDYYPQLSELKGKPQDASALVNRQIHVTLILIGPFLIASIAFAPITLVLLYAESFLEATLLTQWMTLGNVFKSMAWPIVFVAIAQGHGRLLLAIELAWMVSFLAITWLGFPFLGITGVGFAFFVACVSYLIAAYVVANQLIGLRFRRDNVYIFVVLMLVCSILFCLSFESRIAGYYAGTVLFITNAIFAYRTIIRLTSVNAIGTLISRLKRA